MGKKDKFVPSGIYHIYNHANGFEDMFLQSENYNYFLSKYGEYMEGVAKTLAYCLIPNHFHILIEVMPKDVLKAYYLNRQRLNLLQNQIQDEIDNLDYHSIVHRQLSNFLNGYVKAFNKFHNREGSWVTKHKMPQVMIGMAAVADTANGKIYLIGGVPSYFSSASNKVYEYDPLLDTFIAKTPLPEPRAFMAACEWNGDIYAIGGTTQAGAGEVFQTVLKYNPSNPLGWVSVNSLIKKRNVAAAVVLDDKIFVTGGDEEGLLNGSKTTEVLDLTAPGSAWMLLGADMMADRWMHGAGVIDGQLYVFGGASDGAELSSVEMLDMSNGEWVAGPDMLAQRRMFAYASYDDAIYAAGGQGGGIVLNRFEKFSIVSSANDRQSGGVGLLYQNYPNPFVGSTTN